MRKSADVSDPRVQAQQLSFEAMFLPHGPTQVAMLEEAVQLADSVNDVDLAFGLRDDLMTAATFSGRPDIMLVHFAWCLAQHDREPDRFDTFGLMWKYKWVVENSKKFPQISRSKLEELLADMKRRYDEYGASPYSEALERRSLMMHFGEREAAAEAHADLRRSQRDMLSNCIACVASEDCGYFCFQRQWKRALQAARPVLDGRMSCTEQPHIILGAVLLPLLRLKRLDDAKAHQAQGYRLVSRGRQFVREHAAHIRFLALIGDVTPAKRMMERHLPGVLEIPLLDERFEFFLAAKLLCDRLVQLKKSKPKLRLPDGLPVPGADGKSDASSLGEWFAMEARSIARQFDERNRSTTFQQQIDELPEALKLAVD